MKYIASNFYYKELVILYYKELAYILYTKAFLYNEKKYYLENLKLLAGFYYIIDHDIICLSSQALLMYWGIYNILS